VQRQHGGVGQQCNQQPWRIGATCSLDIQHLVDDGDSAGVREFAQFSVLVNKSPV